MPCQTFLRLLKFVVGDLKAGCFAKPFQYNTSFQNVSLRVTSGEVTVNIDKKIILIRQSGQIFGIYSLLGQHKASFFKKICHISFLKHPKILLMGPINRFPYVA